MSVPRSFTFTAHYPTDKEADLFSCTKVMLRGGPGRGRTARAHAARTPPALTVVVSLNETLRGRVIGPQGVTVKATQRQTKAQVQAPRRGEPGPVKVSGDSASSVLQACCLIGRQTAASSDCVCTVPGLGDLAATLHATDVDDPARRLLFEASSSSCAAAFVAYVLPPLPQDVSRARVASILDDILFSVGTPPDGSFGQAIGEDGDLYIFGVGSAAAAVAEGLYRELLKSIYTLDAAAVRAAERAARAAAAVASDTASLEVEGSLCGLIRALQTGSRAVVACETETELLATFPDSPQDGQLHVVVNPGFDAVPLPFMPAGWMLACAHWPELEPASGEPWSAARPGGSLLRGGCVARTLCFRYTNAAPASS